MVFKREFDPECMSGSCGYYYSDNSISCEGDVGCFAAFLVEGHHTEHHDEILINATKAIKAILDMIPEDPTGKGRNPSFLQTNLGLFLAWVGHDTEASSDGITKDSRDEEIVEALGLKVDSPKHFELLVGKEDK